MQGLVFRGLQKLSLIDFPGRLCAIVFTQGCVFACGYCHNPELIPFSSESMIGEDEILEFLSHGRSMVDSICITGGEPTLHKGLLPFLYRLKSEGFHVKLDTNGIHPSIVKRAISEKLVDYIAMDIKAPWHKYLSVIRRGGEGVIEQCRQTFAIIQESGIEHEFRTTIYPGIHTREDFFEMCGYLNTGEHYFIQKTSFRKNLDLSLSRITGFDIDSLVKILKETFSDCIIDQR